MTTLKLNPTRLLYRGLVLFLFVLCIPFKGLAQPAISSFSPASGPVGTSVTITGTNFSTTAANNIVFIGSIKAIVTSATATALTVTVPAGAVFQPISVTTNGLTAWSGKPFSVTFSGGSPVFTPQSLAYAARVDSVSSSIETTKYAVGDLDGDNRLDVVTIDRLNNTMSVYRNTTTGSNISFAVKTDFTTGQSPRAVAIADIDGDGKPDVIVTNLNDNTVSIFRNTISGSAISFASKVDVATATQPAGISVTDLDQDGKPDLVINTVNFQGYVSILRNTGSIGTISFAPRFDLQTVGGSIEEVRTADIDADGKPDIVVPDYASGTIKIFRNTSSSGNIAFAASVGVNVYTNPDDVVVADFNDDGKPDLAISYYVSNSVLVLQNVTSSGNIVFQYNNYFGAGSVNGMAVSDLDGDGKPDLAINLDLQSVFLLRNTSTSGGTIAFGSSATVPAFPTSHAMVGDFDNDGKPDLAFNSGLYRVTVWKNRETSPLVSSFYPTSGKAGDTIAVYGSNFTGATTVSFGGVQAASFTVENGTKISAIPGSGGTGDVKIVTASDSGSLSGFVYLGPPIISSFAPDSGASYEKIIIRGRNFTGTTSVKFGGVAATFNVIDPFTIEAYIGTGASGNVSVTNAYGTAVQSGFKYVPKPYLSSFTPTEAITGATVTIKGFNFTGVTSVGFGSTPAASFTVVDSATIQAVVDNGSSDGSVYVTNAHGTATKTGFTYYPPPVITSFTPDTAAQGDTVTIRGLNFLHDYNYSLISAVKFGGVQAAAFSIIDSFTIRAKVNYGASGAVTIESNRGNASMPGFTFISPPYIASVSPQIIGAGTEVIITGLNFTPTTSVTFGGVAASSFTVVSASTIKAIIGAGASGAVTITTPKHQVSGGQVSYSTAPMIYRVSPISGPAGTTVTISGINFQPGAANNTVYFGGVKAVVLSATANTVTVTAPTGADYKPITVTSLANRLTAISNDRFNVTFPVDTAAFNDSSFAGKMDFITGDDPYMVKHADIDGDGKPDIILINHGSAFVSVFRNISTPGRLSFAPRTDIPIGFPAKALAVGDIDADGKIDLIISNDMPGNPLVYVFRNQSTAGNLSFVNAHSMGGLPYYMGVIETADLNMDGRTDIVLLCNNCGAPGSITVCANNGSNGNISFADPATYTYYGYDVQTYTGINADFAVTDFNHDGKPDVAVGMSMSSSLFLFKNITQPGAFTIFDYSVFDNYLSYRGFSTVPLFTATLHSQDYPDLISGPFVLKNNAGSFSEVSRKYTYAACVYDLNGDGKQDIVGNNSSGLCLTKNTGDSNSISFAPDYNLNMVAGSLDAGDLDGDSKPEIFMVYSNSNTLRILRNRMGEALPPKPSITSFSPQTAAFSNQVLITGGNFDQATSVAFGGVPALYFTIVSGDSILATIANGASGSVSVTTPGGTDSLGGFTFIPLPVITAITPTAGMPGTTDTITGSNFTGATAVSFGGVAASSFTVKSADSIIAIVGNGATGSVSVTTPGGIATLDKFICYLPPVISGIGPTSATTNGQVVISGAHFEGVNSVTFGGIPVNSFTIYPDYKSIVATIGAGASGSVTVVNPAGTASWPGFTFISPYNPAIFSFTPVTGSTGTAVTIKGRFFSGTTAVSFGGTAASSFTVVDSTTIIAVVGVGATGNVSVITPYGATALTGFTYNNVTAIVDPANVNSKDLTVSPNPAHDILVIDHPASAKNTFLRFIDILGREVKTVIPARNGTQTITNVNGLMAGMYTIVWSDGLRTLSRVFLVQ